MSNKIMTDKEAIDALYAVYCDAYNDQLDAAEEWYLEEFEPRFAPPDEPWATKEDAKSAFESLVSELYEDRDDTDELLNDCGLTEELIEFFGLDM